MKRFAAALFAFLLSASIAAAGVALWAMDRFDRAGPLDEPKIVLVPRGAGVKSIAALLEREGVVSDAWLVELGARLVDPDVPLKAGEYEFPAGTSARAALALLREGRTVAYFVTVPEGLTSHQIVELLRGVEGLTGEIADIPPEGSLLPETYQFVRGDSRQDVLDRMTAARVKAIDELWPGRAEGLPFTTKEEALVLASIVEKETGIASERPMVAAVFVNRLKKGMKLQADPTVVYAATEGKGPLGRSIRRSDLNRDSPYNTYLHVGLPPGPIANPGRDAIAAVLNPADAKALYFVADGTGGHVFADTLAEHNRNVANWRKHEREKAKKDKK